MNNKTSESGLPAKTGINRRGVLKGAIATAPLIATLPSGAALARSSNIIGRVSAAGSLDSLGRTQCLDYRSGRVLQKGALMDLGTPPRGSVTAITQRDYRKTASDSGTPISEAEMCNQGGAFYYKGTSWQTANVPRGMLVSATALSSFAGAIRYTEV